MAYVIGLAIERTIGFRLAEEDEVTGVDQVEHAESAYDLLGGGSTVRPSPVQGRGAHETHQEVPA
jgi:Amt family ammonium transporter